MPCSPSHRRHLPTARRRSVYRTFCKPCCSSDGTRPSPGLTRRRCALAPDPTEHRSRARHITCNSPVFDARYSMPASRSRKPQAPHAQDDFYQANSRHCRPTRGGIPGHHGLEPPLGEQKPAGPGKPIGKCTATAGTHAAQTNACHGTSRCPCLAAPAPADNARCATRTCPGCDQAIAGTARIDATRGDRQTDRPPRRPVPANQAVVRLAVF